MIPGQRDKRVLYMRYDEENGEMHDDFNDPMYQQRVDNNHPFEAENDLDNLVIRDYLRRNKIQMDLPDVPFKKGNRDGLYIIGQRRIQVDEIDDEVVVIIGKRWENFIRFIEKQEKIEGLKRKALNSAGGLLNIISR